MKRFLMTTLTVLLIGTIVCLAAYAGIDPNSISDPNEIKLPEGARMPVQLKCPVHGRIGRGFIAIETDSGTKIHCTQCVKTFVSRLFEVNLPNLEIVK